MPKRRKSHPDQALPTLGETEAADSSAPESNLATAGLIRDSEANSDEVRDKLRLLVPGLESPATYYSPSSFTEMDVGSVHVEIDSPSQQKNLRRESNATSQFIREKLRQIVPGLTDFSFWEPGRNFQHEPFVGVVHVTLANSSSVPSLSMSSMDNRSATSTRKVVLASTAQSTDTNLATTSHSQVDTIHLRKYWPTTPTWKPRLN